MSPFKIPVIQAAEIAVNNIQMYIFNALWVSLHKSHCQMYTGSQKPGIVTGLLLFFYIFERHFVCSLILKYIQIENNYINSVSFIWLYLLLFGYGNQDFFSFHQSINPWSWIVFFGTVTISLFMLLTSFWADFDFQEPLPCKLYIV